MKRVKAVSIIRERGQVTIPDRIRKMVKWAVPSSVVDISLEKPDEIRIQPHTSQKEVDWEKVWSAIHLARSFMGARGNLSAFIAEDRLRGHN